MRLFKSLLALCLPGLVIGCTVAPPSGPTVVALPSQGKDLQSFQREDYGCRGYAQGAVGNIAGAQKAAQNASVGSTLVGTALGAAAGALVGSIGGAAGAGAAVGAGVGALAGSSSGANQAGAIGGSLQQNYNVAYAQCMTSAGNSIQAPPVVAYAAPYYGYYGPYYGPSVGFGYYGGWGRYRGW